MNSTHLLVIIAILLIIVIVKYNNQIYNSSSEHLTNTEAVSNISSIYNTVGEIVAPKMKTIGDSNVGGSLNVEGSVNFLPLGSIIIWYGNLNTIPSGWQACDGTNGTPDLQSRFVYGSAAKPGTGALAYFGGKGGEENHMLTQDEIPVHNHGINFGGANDLRWNTKYGGPFIIGADDIPQGKASAITSNTGKGKAHNNMPPYYSLFYIMRMK